MENIDYQRLLAHRIQVGHRRRYPFSHTEFQTNKFSVVDNTGKYALVYTKRTAVGKCQGAYAHPLRICAGVPEAFPTVT
jgi:hypothetical protein